MRGDRGAGPPRRARGRREPPWGPRRPSSASRAWPPSPRARRTRAPSRPRRGSRCAVLRPRDPASLRRFIAATSTPGGPRFRKFLPRDAFARRFGPTSAAIAAVRDLLDDDGLAVTAISPSHLVLSVDGRASRFAAALHAPLERYELASGATSYRLGGAARLPAGVARDVSGIVGVASVGERSFARHAARASRRVVRAYVAVRTASHVDPRLAPGGPCPDAAAALGGGTFTPTQEGQLDGLATAWTHGDDGTGRTIALEEFAPYATSASSPTTCASTSCRRARRRTRSCATCSSTGGPRRERGGLGRADARHRGGPRARPGCRRRGLRGPEQRDGADRHPPADRDGRHRPGR